ncbi:hypothetical protein AXW82_00620 [Mycoplasmopsis canis PG 14]|uniref:Uncharacterized conserved protein n=1 Tax=Mycoplasmopsis canis TaxID=29555 RepID=A0A449AQN6_9BACT|nr:DUF262 domain-containing protein [Mycoplasmopsis canis]AMD81070.1 hypothetical protein AXW82_00620 [Mycoplasmopsis canis PG 14]VEU68884.1 Uncharacterized conserved protein [Mycoplasmopsis canis]
MPKEKSIYATNKNIEELFGDLKNSYFLIPDYQRPYSWSEDEVITLFNDLWEYYIFNNESNERDPYFLGNIVIFKNSNNEYEVIDGQQRITTISLLIRAMYFMLEKNVDSNNRDVTILKQKLETILWQQKDSSYNPDFSKFKLYSKVINDKNKLIFEEILKNGIYNEKSKDNYSKNYNVILDLIKEKSEETTTGIINFYRFIIERVLILKIELNNFDTALNIFSTLNNRGLQLSDADIFKSIIYSKIKGSNEKDDFIKNWKSLDLEINDNNETMQKIFTYCMFYIRSLNNDTSSTTPKIRDYFLKQHGSSFLEYPDKLLELLSNINDFMGVVNKRNTIENQEWSKDIGIIQKLDILRSYPNEFWKYPVINYYMSHHKKVDFVYHFDFFLKKLIISLITKYIEIPSVNGIKGSILQINANSINNLSPKMDFKRKITIENLRNELKEPHPNILKMILKLISYNVEDEMNLLPEKWEIEHILPKNWEKIYHTNDDINLINKSIEELGNKIPLEKKANILSGDNFLKKKLDEYKKSNIKIVKIFVQEHNDQIYWGINDIKKRNEKLIEEILNVFEKWNSEYNVLKEN